MPRAKIDRSSNPATTRSCALKHANPPRRQRSIARRARLAKRALTRVARTPSRSASAVKPAPQSRSPAPWARARRPMFRRSLRSALAPKTSSVASCADWFAASARPSSARALRQQRKAAHSSRTDTEERTPALPCPAALSEPIPLRNRPLTRSRNRTPYPGRARQSGRLPQILGSAISVVSAARW